METCRPPHGQRRELLTDLLQLVAQEDDKTIHLLLGILAQLKRAAG
jgi:hypothetical protein